MAASEPKEQVQPKSNTTLTEKEPKGYWQRLQDYFFGPKSGEDGPKKIGDEPVEPLGQLPSRVRPFADKLVPDDPDHGLGDDSV